MKVLWSRCTSHLLSHLGSMIKEKKLKLPSMTILVEVLQQGKKEDNYSQEDQPIRRREIVRNFGSEVLCKGKCREVERRGRVTVIYCSNQYIRLLETKISLSGEA